MAATAVFITLFIILAPLFFNKDIPDGLQDAIGFALMFLFTPLFFLILYILG